MKEILYNMALIFATNTCKENKIDCSGSHLIKYPRRFTYALISDNDGRAIITITLHKSSVPSYSFN